MADSERARVYALLDTSADGRALVFGVYAARDAALAAMQRAADERTRCDPARPYTVIDDPTLGDAVCGVEESVLTVGEYLAVVEQVLQ